MNAWKNDVVIEISEKTFVNDLSTCAFFIEKYKKAGFKIAIDDFGSEYSALNILGSINYDVLKLEGNFGMNVLSELNEAIVKMVKNIADLSNKTIVVEGVETVEQSEKLANLGCVYQQGYYHHRPSKLN